jgi:hypothetical protein
MPRKKADDNTLRMNAYAFDSAEETLLHDLAALDNATPLETLKRALYTYAAVRPHQDSPLFMQYRNAQDRLCVKRILLP